MRTISEVRKHLKDRDYSSEEIDNAIEELVSLRYLDDYQFAVSYYEYNREKKRGSLRAERELAEKGVAKDIIRNAREDFLYENKVDEYEDALAVARKEVFVPADIYGTAEIVNQVDEKLSARIARKLESKGFARNDIFRVLDTLRRESSE